MYNLLPSIRNIIAINSLLTLLMLSLMSASFAVIGVGLAHAARPSGPPVPAGIIGSKIPASFYVVDVATDNSGNVYAVDAFYKTFSKYTANGKLLMQVKTRGQWPRSIAIDSAERVYVLDTSIGQVEVYSPSGDLLNVWGNFIGAQHAVNIGIDENDTVYIVLNALDTVVLFDTNGNETTSFGDSSLFSEPYDITSAPDGSIYVTDRGDHTVKRFDQSGGLIQTFGGYGSLPGQLHYPASVAVDSLGNVFVSDRRNYRVQKFDDQGNLIVVIGERGEDPGQFFEHHGIAVGPDDTLWVAGYHNHDIQHFRNDGILLVQWRGHVSGQGEFADTKGVGILDDKLFIVDGWNQRVQVFDAMTGQYLYEFGEKGQQGLAETVFNFPRALTIGPSGDLYISDDRQVRRIQPDGTFVGIYPWIFGPTPGAAGLVVSHENILFQTSKGGEVIKYDSNREISLRFGESGSAAGQFDKPSGLALLPDDTLYVADTNNHRVQRFTLDGTYLDERSIVGGPWALATDTKHEILYVGSAYWSQVSAYDFNGAFLFNWGRKGYEIGEFPFIYGIAVGEDSALYISEGRGGRVQKFVYPTEVDVIGSPTYKGGKDLGFFLWRDELSGKWRLRWSGDGGRHRFAVTIETLDGTFSEVQAIGFEGVDRLNFSDHEILIDARASTWIDGVDFSATPGSVVRFDFLIDGISALGNVYIGSESNIPDNIPFYLQ